MGRRPRRVGEQVLRELGEIFQRGLVRDPAIGYLTITAVDMSPDLRHARVFYSVYGDDVDHDATQRALERAAPFVRRELGRRLRTKVTPEPRFELDISLERAARVEELLRRDRDTGAEDDSEDPGEEVSGESPTRD